MILEQMIVKTTLIPVEVSILPFSGMSVVPSSVTPSSWNSLQHTDATFSPGQQWDTNHIK